MTSLPSQKPFFICPNRNGGRVNDRDRHPLVLVLSAGVREGSQPDRVTWSMIYELVGGAK
jgi:hypothetical protein